MRITYSWLKDYIHFEENPFALADKLTNVGFEVEEIIPLVQPFRGVVVAKVEKVSKHPDADKLRVCKVSDGKESFQVICGAPNVAAGQYVPFAKVGAHLPGDFKIKKARIRGIESFGMICSKEELGLEKQSDGIWPFDEKYPLGADVYQLLAEKQDYIYDFFITPNRPDCLSAIGIAREIAAITGLPLRMPKVNLSSVVSNHSHPLPKVTIEDSDGCPRYSARIIRNVEIGPSPQWMQERLEACGIRPINNIVDITNYVLMEYGQPLHAFDLRQIKGGEIIVRSSRPNEKFITLDDKERILPESTVLICDRERAVAIGGIMGGQNSEVSSTTKDILLESAYFKPTRIAFSSKKLGLSSEASQRFERGVDPNGIMEASDRAAALMAELARGEIDQSVTDVYPVRIEPKSIRFRPERINRVLGSHIAEDKIVTLLEGLGLSIKGGFVTVPTFRVDLSQEIDLAEEVARLLNYANLPTHHSVQIRYDLEETSSDRLLAFLRDELIHLGLQEVFTNSMLKESEAELFQNGKNIRILNPISDDMTTMRPSLLPGLLKAVAYNVNRNMSDGRFFEIGRIFTNYQENELPQQPYALAVVITGRRYPESWNNPQEVVDFYDIKGYVENFLSKIFLDNFHFILYDKDSYMAKGETISIETGQHRIGLCGKISPEIVRFFDVNQDVYGFELNIDLLAGFLNQSRPYKPIARFPYSERDMALVVDQSVPAEEILSFIRRTGGKLLHFTDVFDVYEGDKIPAGKKSLAIRMRFQSMEKTLSDKEVDKIFHKIIKECGKQFQASLRK